MLRGYRLIIIAIGLVLSGPSYGKESNGDQRAAPNDRNAQFERIASAIEELPKSEAPDRGCRPGQDDRQSDLCAQWKAADAATESARWTLWTLIATGFGLVIGGGTLFAAWRAAHWAKKAADHTETGATAAIEAARESRDANAIAREALVVGGRAWLKVDAAILGTLEITGDPPEVRASIDLIITNVGGTPATDVCIQIELRHGWGLGLGPMQKAISDKLRQSPEGSWFPKTTIFPAQPARFTYNLGAGNEELVAARTQFEGTGSSIVHIGLIILGCVQYRLPGSPTLHQTGISYNVELIPTADRGQGIFEGDLPIRADRLQLRLPLEGPGPID